VKALLLRSLLVAVLVGPAIRLINKVTSLQDGVKYDPPISAAEPAAGTTPCPTETRCNRRDIIELARH